MRTLQQLSPSLYLHGQNWQIEKIASWTAAKFEPGTNKKGQ
jgi:hypothetical protein